MAADDATFRGTDWPVGVGRAQSPPSENSKTCPSAFAKEGVRLLGVITPAARVAFIHPPTHVDADFVARIAAEGRPEARYRFAAPCIEGRCPQWTGTGCHVVDEVVDANILDDGGWERVARPSTASRSRLPACGIRSSCRWFYQRGRSACEVCPSIIADAGGTATYRSKNQPSTS
jgi:hypothetical protein